MHFSWIDVPEPARPARLLAQDFGLPEHVTCPFCNTQETELHSAFGGQLSVTTYWCRRCFTAFEWFRNKPTDR